MYAIIKTGGKQYRVEKDAVIDVELLDADVGAHVNFEEILFVNNGNEAIVGGPNVAGYLVKGEVLGTSVGPKVTSMKYTPRQHSRKKWGHRQHYMQIKILGVESADKKAHSKNVKEKGVE